MSVIDDIAAAIQQMEGWFPGSVAYRNNNPGNLRAGKGQIGTDPNGYAIFPDYQTGYLALTNQISLNVNRGLTLMEFFGGKPGVYAGYAPSADKNNPTNYAAFVGSQTGIPVDVPLNNVAGITPKGGTNKDVSNPNLTVDSGSSSSSGGGDVSSFSDVTAMDLASISWFDGEGNFAPTPLAWVISIGGLTLLVSALKG